MSFCPACAQGVTLSGEPIGSWVPKGGELGLPLDAYFAAAPAPSTAAATDVSTGGVGASVTEGQTDVSTGGVGASTPTPPTTNNVAIIILMDAFGFGLQNPKVMADQLASKTGCDVWVPDYFLGRPPFPADAMHFPEVPGKGLTFGGIVKLIWVALTNIGNILANRAGALDERSISFAKKLKEVKGYEKVGAVGYCMGGATVIRIGSSDAIDSAVIAHPGRCNIEQIKAIKVPSSWACAEEDFSFGPKLRNEAEAVFAARKDKPEFIEYEFKDWKGTTHGFAARPNMEIQSVKEGFEGSFAQTVGWFKKTLFV